MNKESYFLMFGVYFLVGSLYIFFLIHPLNLINFVFSLIGSLSMLYAGYNLGKVFE